MCLIRMLPNVSLFLDIFRSRVSRKFHVYIYLQIFSATVHDAFHKLHFKVKCTLRISDSPLLFFH